jgi:hypothetical protein
MAARTRGACWGIVSLAVAVIGGALVACAPDGDRSSLTNASQAGESDLTTGDNGGASGAPGKTGNGDDIVLPNISAKEYFTKNVQPALAQSCASCHGANGTGPTWIASADVEKSYSLMFLRGYVSRTSTLVQKGPHSSNAPALSKDQSVKVMTWIELELKERGDKAPPSVLEKLGSCLDQTKFDAIKFGTLVTVARNANNNPNKQAENANECTGCAAAPCSTCHSADPGTGFMMAVGNDILPADHTFKESKASTPPYMQKYFGLDTSGDPVASNAIKTKSDVTVQANAYTHPMYVLTPAMETAIKAYVDDAIAKYKSGACGQ